MAAQETILTLHPDPTKQGVRIDKAKYDRVRAAILENLREFGPLSLKKLGELVAEQLQADFDGSVSWYFTVVKLDLEARGELRRAPKSKPGVFQSKGWI